MLIPQYVRDILTTLKQAGYAAYLVGGCVRDHLLGKEPQDYDIATSALPEQVLELFPKTVPTGVKHGTVTVVTSEGSCEVTTFRKGGPWELNDSRHEHPFSNSIEEDLAHRDFTMNAIAYDGVHFVDPFCGREDLQEKRIRAVRDPLARFEEDALRMLRAVRFAAQLQFVIEDTTRAAISRNLSLLNSTSVERIRDELSRILVSSHPVYGFQLMEELGLLKLLLPELMSTGFMVLAHTPPQLALRWAAILHDIERAEQLLKRLRYGRRLITLIIGLLKEVEFMARNRKKDRTFDEESMVEIKKMVVRLGAENMDLLFQLLLARAKVDPSPLTKEEVGQLRKKVERILSEKHPLTLKDLNINGQDLLQLGFKEGPEIGRLMHRLWEAVLEEPGLNKRDILIDLAKRYSSWK